MTFYLWQSYMIGYRLAQTAKIFMWVFPKDGKNIVSGCVVDVAPNIVTFHANYQHI